VSFERACSLADLTEGEALGVVVAGQDVALARDGADVFAVEDQCTHALVALSEGGVESEGGECSIECWLHGSRFDLRTGKPTGLPATEPVATFPVELRDGDVYVDTSTTLNGVTPQ
jgi:3-phenylpropionate/trans-cinnamate dioxygenase ferredoxin component